MSKNLTLDTDFFDSDESKRIKKINNKILTNVFLLMLLSILLFAAVSIVIGGIFDLLLKHVIGFMLSPKDRNVHPGFLFIFPCASVVIFLFLFANYLDKNSCAQLSSSFIRYNSFSPTIKFIKIFKVISYFLLVIGIVLFFSTFPLLGFFAVRNFWDTILFLCLLYAPSILLTALSSYFIVTHIQKITPCKKCKRYTPKTTLSSKDLGTHKTYTRDHITGFQMPKEHTVAKFKDSNNNNYRIYTKEHAHFNYEKATYADGTKNEQRQCLFCKNEENITVEYTKRIN